MMEIIKYSLKYILLYYKFIITPSLSPSLHQDLSKCSGLVQGVLDLSPLKIRSWLFRAINGQAPYSIHMHKTRHIGVYFTPSPINCST